jgi:hypothetical protein
MRTIVRTIGAMLAIVAFMATFAGSALADSHNEASRLLPDSSYDNTDLFAFTPLCGPCGMDGGTGTELLIDAFVEHDADADGLGDETQDPDGGGLGQNWEDDWFEDYESGDKAVLVTTEPNGGSPTPTSNPVLATALT